MALKFLTEIYPGVFIHNRQLRLPDAHCKAHNRRVDFQTTIKGEFTTYLVVTEIDENQHKYYDPNDEIERINQIFEDLGMKMVFIRFNPDGYKIGSVRKRTPMEKRYQALKAKYEEVKIQARSSGFPDYYTEIKLFYDQEI